jgi:hypothetical protein
MTRPRKITPQRGQIEEWSPTLLKARLYNRLLVDIIIGDLPPGWRWKGWWCAARGSAPWWRPWIRTMPMTPLPPVP